MRWWRPPGVVEVFPACGADAWGRVQELRGRAEVRIVDSPRHATVLLVAGTIAPEHLTALARVHDQLPHPRATVTWGSTSGDRPDAFTAGPSEQDVVDVVHHAAEVVQRDPSRSSPGWLADEPQPGRDDDPPYGRPMAMTADDRDGLALDEVHVRLGPFLTMLPAGVVVDVTLQGDLVRSLSCVRDPVVSAAGGGPLDSTSGLRARLRWLAYALHVHGVDPLARRAARLAAAAETTPRSELSRRVLALRSAIDRSGLVWSLRGVATIDGEDAAARWTRRLDATVADAIAEASPDDRAHAGTDGALAADPAAEPADELADGVVGALAGCPLDEAISGLVSLAPATGTPHGAGRGRP